MLLNLLAILAAVSWCGGVNGEEESKKEVTKCDESIAKAMCDHFREEATDCALLMPNDEHPIFYDCAQELEVSTSRDWTPLFDDLCQKEHIAQTVLDLITCWDEKMNTTVDEMQDDKVYPFEHFMCKEKLYEDAVRKTSCACQSEKGVVCKKTPPPSSPPPPSMG